MKAGGEIVCTIDKDGNVRLQILNNDSPGHGEYLTPFEKTLSDGEAGRVMKQRHDHVHGAHTHTHGGSH